MNIIEAMIQSTQSYDNIAADKIYRNNHSRGRGVGNDKGFKSLLGDSIKKKNPSLNDKREISKENDTTNEISADEEKKTDLHDGGILALFSLLNITFEKNNEKSSIEQINDKISAMSSDLTLKDLEKIVDLASLSDKQLYNEISPMSKQDISSLMDKLSQLQLLIKKSLTDDKDFSFDKKFFSGIDLDDKHQGKQVDNPSELRTRMMKIISQVETKIVEQIKPNQEAGVKNLLVKITQLELHLKARFNSADARVDDSTTIRNINQLNTKQNPQQNPQMTEGNKTTTLLGDIASFADKIVAQADYRENTNNRKSNSKDNDSRGVKNSAHNIFAGNEDNSVDLTKVNKIAIDRLKLNDLSQQYSLKKVKESMISDEVNRKSESANTDLNSSKTIKLNNLDISKLNYASIGSRPDNIAFDRTLIDGKVSTPNVVKQGEIYDQIDKQIQSVMRTGQKEMEIQLEPESLGKVNLKVQIKDGKVSVYFNVDNDMVKGQLEQNINHLKQNFLRQGYNLDHVLIETEDQRTAFRHHQGNQDQQQQQNSPYQGQEQDSQYEGLSPGEIYQLMVDEQYLSDEERGKLTPHNWYQHKYGYPSINMDYLI